VLSPTFGFDLFLFGLGSVLCTLAAWSYRLEGASRSTYLLTWVALMTAGFGASNLATRVPFGDPAGLVARGAAGLLLVGSLFAAYRASLAERKAAPAD
jgi:hypothetical protein